MEQNSVCEHILAEWQVTCRQLKYLPKLCTSNGWELDNFSTSAFAKDKYERDLP